MSEHLETAVAAVTKANELLDTAVAGFTPASPLAVPPPPGQLIGALAGVVGALLTGTNQLVAAVQIQERKIERLETQIAELRTTKDEAE